MHHYTPEDLPFACRLSAAMPLALESEGLQVLKAPLPQGQNMRSKAVVTCQTARWSEDT